MSYDLTDEQVAGRLGGMKPGSDGFYCRCPAHDDKKASLWIKQRDGGGLHVKCHAHCSRENVEAALKQHNLWPRSGARKPDNKDAKRRDRAAEQVAASVAPVPTEAPEIDWSAFRRELPTALYPYRDVLGRVLMYVGRWDDLDTGKDIRPVSLARLAGGRLDWQLKALSGPSTLYGLEILPSRPEAPVLIVEGEKTADAGRLKFPDHVVMTWRGGAASVAKADFSPLRGRQVVLWPDADDAGQKAMADVAGMAFAAGAASVRLVDLPKESPKGWDLADDAPQGVDIAALLKASRPVCQVSASEPVGEEEEEEVRQPAVGPGLRPLVVGADELMKLELPERKLIVDPFLATSSLSMIYGPRGSGKTWVGLSLAMAVAQGENFLAYTVKRPWTVLFIDGEMAIADLKQRVRLLCPSPPPALLILPSERLFREARPLNLHDPEDQKAIEQMIADLESEGRRPDMMIFDNLSSLSGGVDENDNSALDHLLRWLIGLRHMGMAIVLVHHAGKNGSQRGASRREDLLDTSISLTLPSEDASPHQGAHLVLTFAKTRGQRPDPEALELRLAEYNGQLQWQFGNPAQIDRATEILRIAWERRPKTQAELAAYAGVKESAVSHQVKKLRRDDYLEDGSPPTLTQSGRERLIEVWPELYSKMVAQGELALRDIM